MNFFSVILLVTFLGNGSGQLTNDSSIENADKLLGKLARDYMEIRYHKFNVNEFIYVGAKRQMLYFIRDTTIVCKYKISTSKYGIGSELNSNKTPTGLHKIESKIGHDVPLNGIILGKKFTGKIAEIINEPKSGLTDDVTTRAIRLEGIEKGLNQGGRKDSYLRDIYIHGTPEEGLIGQPASHGCIRMKNIEVINLFNEVQKGTYVLILNN